MALAWVEQGAQSSSSLASPEVDDTLSMAPGKLRSVSASKRLEIYNYRNILITYIKGNVKLDDFEYHIVPLGLSHLHKHVIRGIETGDRCLEDA